MLCVEGNTGIIAHAYSINDSNFNQTVVDQIGYKFFTSLPQLSLVYSQKNVILKVSLERNKPNATPQ